MRIFFISHHAEFPPRAQLRWRFGQRPNQQQQATWIPPQWVSPNGWFIMEHSIKIWMIWGLLDLVELLWCDGWRMLLWMPDELVGTVLDKHFPTPATSSSIAGGVLAALVGTIPPPSMDVGQHPLFPSFSLFFFFFCLNYSNYAALVSFYVFLYHFVSTACASPTKEGVHRASWRQWMQLLSPNAFP